MNIRDVHNYLTGTVLASLAITAPYALTVQKAWKFIPPANQGLAALPVTISTYQLEQVYFKPAFLEQQYAIRIQLFAAPAAMQTDEGADIASAFLDALVTALSAHQSLGTNVSVIRGLRGGPGGAGGPETLTVLSWAGVSYVGLDLYLDVTLKTAAVHAA